MPPPIFVFYHKYFIISTRRRLRFFGKGIPTNYELLEKEFSEYGKVENISFPKLQDYNNTDSKDSATEERYIVEY